MYILIKISNHLTDPTLGNCPWTNGFSTSLDECMEYDTLRGTIDGCLGSCDQEAWCNGVSYDNLTRLCYRFPCGRTTAVSENTFYSRICQGIYLNYDMTEYLLNGVTKNKILSKHIIKQLQPPK